MLKIPVYNIKAGKVEEQDFNEKKIKRVSDEAIYQVIVSMQSNQRAGSAHAKTKAEVRGGGKKPWRQKGTGRARHGSIRSPIWKGGGVTFGPRNTRNWKKKINKKMKQAVFKTLLLDKAVNKKVCILKIEKDLEKPKSKIIRELKEKLKIGKVLFVGDKNLPNLKKSVLNFPGIEYISSDSVSCLNIVSKDFSLFTDKAWKKVLALKDKKKSTEPIKSKKE